MFSHIMIGTNDLERSRLFYDAALGALGVPAGWVDRHRVFWRMPSGVFSVSLPIDGQPPWPRSNMAARHRSSQALALSAGWRSR